MRVLRRHTGARHDGPRSATEQGRTTHGGQCCGCVRTLQLRQRQPDSGGIHAAVLVERGNRVSVIAAKRAGKGKIEVACDSQTTYGDIKEQNHVGKITLVSKRFAVGAVGLSEAGALLRRYAKSRRPERNDEDGIADFIIDFYEWGEKRTADVEHLNKESEYLLVLEDRIWSVHGHLVQEHKDHYAIGSGMGEARAAMLLGKTAEEAVRVACEINLYCHEPVVTFTIKSKSEEQA